MAKNSAVNLDITNNADGFDVSGGTTKRKSTFTGADMTFTGSGSATFTFPGATTTLVGTDATQTLTNKTIAAGSNTLSGLWQIANGTFSGATSTTISSLTGNTAEVYELYVYGKFSTADRIGLRFNADTGNNYATVYTTVSFNGVSTTTEANNTDNEVSSIRGMPENSYKEQWVKFTIYATSGNNRLVLVQSNGRDNGSSTGAMQTVTGSGAWTNTADEITSITILAVNANNFQSGSEYWLSRKS